MAIRPIDGNKLIEWFSPYLHTGEPIPADVVIEDIRSMPTLTPPNEWVRVEERLPNDKQIVLFHQKDEFIYCAEYFEGNKILSSAWFIDNDSWEAEEVTHWMPMPAPPDRRPPEGEGS